MSRPEKRRHSPIEYPIRGSGGTGGERKGDARSRDAAGKRDFDRWDPAAAEARTDWDSSHRSDRWEASTTPTERPMASDSLLQTLALYALHCAKSFVRLTLHFVAGCGALFFYVRA
jgi:hypothetical protein